MVDDSAPRKQLIGEITGLGDKPQRVVLTAIERKNADVNNTVDTTTYTVQPADTVILVDDDTAGGAVTITLPPAGEAEGRWITVKKLGTTGSVTVDGDASETIDGATTQVISTQYNSLTMTSDSSTWWLI